MSDRYQGELFEEFKEREGSLRRLSKKILPKKKTHVLQISLENLIIFAIVVILGFIISFAIGVEKGKRETQLVSVYQEPIGIEPVFVSAPETVEEKEIEKEVAPELIKPYTIQLISYKVKAKADAKVRQLKAKGIEAVIVKSGDWYQVCAGSYIDKKDAKGDLEKFSKEYRGCFLRNK